jgi:RimJ/RimL family protein N-acetyltransferase
MVVRAHEAGTYRPGWGAYAIVRAFDGRAVGGIGFHAAPGADGEAEVGYDIVTAERGKGYAPRPCAPWPAGRSPGRS